MSVRSRARRAVTSPARRALHTVVRARRSLPFSDAVALTFDDGPDPVHTPLVLDRLRDLGIIGTFFLVGSSARANPDLVRRIVDEGHAVGSHSATHPDPWRLPLLALAAEYRRGHADVARAAGRRVRLFRPPKGFVDDRGAAAMLVAGVRPWLWTVDPRDWEPGVEADQIVHRLDGIAGGDVILLHDAIKGPLDARALDRHATVGALDGIAGLAAARGLRFVSL